MPNGVSSINPEGKSLSEVFPDSFPQNDPHADSVAGKAVGVTKRERDSILLVYAEQSVPAFKPGAVRRVSRVGTRAGLFLLLVDDRGVLLAS